MPIGLTYDGGIGLFSIESNNFNDTTLLWLRGEDSNENGIEYKGQDHYFGQKWMRAEEVIIEEWRIPTLIQIKMEIQII